MHVKLPGQRGVRPEAHQAHEHICPQLERLAGRRSGRPLSLTLSCHLQCDANILNYHLIFEDNNTSIGPNVACSATPPPTAIAPPPRAPRARTPCTVAP